jgi:hypothetical protein
MLHEKRTTREKKPTKEHVPLKESKKCKSHLFKDAYDHVRQLKLELAGRKCVT